MEQELNVKKCGDDAPKTFEIDFENVRIRFRPCGFVSDKPIDVETRYCRLCGVFIEDETYIR